MRNVKRNILRARRTGQINIDDPSPQSFHIKDIAEGLSKVCRWTGQIPFYSVAAHSISVSRLIELTGGSVAEQLAGLLHDAPEAYLGDLPSPIKRRCPEYQAIEARFEAVIYKKFGLPEQMLPIVKWADDELLDYERGELFKNGPTEMYGVGADQVARVQCDFINRFNELYEKHFFGGKLDETDLLRPLNGPTEGDL